MTQRNRPQRAGSRDEGGALLVLASVFLAIILIPLAAYGLDIGNTVAENSALQTLADTGASDAAPYINTALMNGEVADSLKNNNTHTYSGTTEIGVPGCVPQTPGATAASFTPSTTCSNGFYNAVKVTASAPQARFILGGGTLSRSAVAEQVEDAGFSIGTSLVTVSPGSSSLPPLSELFTAALGSSTTLTAVGYNGLVTGNVTLAQLIAASAGVVSPTNILTLGITPAGWAKLLQAADPSLPQSVNYGGSTASGCTVNGTTCLDLCDLVTISPFCPSGILPASDLAISLNELQTLTTTAELANGSSGISVTSALNLGGLLTASLSLRVISPPSVAYGPVGTTATNSQVNATISISTLGVSAATIAIDGAVGTATLTAVNCTGSLNNYVTIAGVTNLAKVVVTVLGVLPVTTNLSGAPNTSIQFNGSVIPPTTTTATGTQPNQNPVTIGTTSPSLGNLVDDISSAVLSPILEALGVSLANASISAQSTLCNSVALVQ